MRQKIKISLLSLFFMFSPIKAELKNYYVLNKAVQVGVNCYGNNFDIIIDYEKPETFADVKNLTLDRALGKINFINLSQDSRIYLIIPKGVEVRNVNEEVVIYDAIKKYTSVRHVSPPTLLERKLEELAHQLVIAGLGFPAIGVKIGKYLAERQEKKWQEYANKLAEINKGYVVKIELNPYVKSPEEFETGVKLSGKAELTYDAKEVMHEAQITDKGVNGAVFYNLIFYKGDSSYNEQVQDSQECRFSLY
ncbi:MAG: hypothetical protein QW244_02550 [Candidatus Pacearchaeota archaeon]